MRTYLIIRRKNSNYITIVRKDTEDEGECGYWEEYYFCANDVNFSRSYIEENFDILGEFALTGNSPINNPIELIDWIPVG